MKKLTFLFSSLLLLMLAACGNKVDYASINDKIADGEQLTQEECGEMINYLHEPIKHMIDLIKEMAHADLGEYENIQDKIENLNQQYPYAESFIKYLTVHADELQGENATNFEKMNEELEKTMREIYSGLQN